MPGIPRPLPLLLLAALAVGCENRNAQQMQEQIADLQTRVVELESQVNDSQSQVDRLVAAVGELDAVMADLDRGVLDLSADGSGGALPDVQAALANAKLKMQAVRASADALARGLAP